MKDKIFDTENREDLPPEFNKILSVNPNHRNFHEDSLQNRMWRLFERQTVLTINEVCVGLYRIYKIIPKRTIVSGGLYSHKKHGLLSLISRGKFKRAEKYKNRVNYYTDQETN